MQIGTLNLNIIETQDPTVLEAIGRLRAEVWRSEQPIEFDEFGDSDCWLDEDDVMGFHWVVYDNGELIASARLSMHQRVQDAPYGHIFSTFGSRMSGKVASINRLVVRKSHRGQGISKILDSLRIMKARELGASVILALPVGELRTSALLRIGYLPLATNVDPERFDVKIKNAKLTALFAPLNAKSDVAAKVVFKDSQTELR